MARRSSPNLKLSDSENRAAVAEKLMTQLPSARRAEFAEALERRDLRCWEMLTTVLVEEQVGRKRGRKLLIVSGVLLEALAFMLLCTAADSIWMHPLWMALSGLSGAALLVGSIANGAPNRLEQAVLETALQDDAKGSIGVLLEEVDLSLMPVELHQRIKQALTVRLQSLTPEDAGLFTPIHRHKICQILRSESLVSEPSLLFAALFALQQVGDAVCLGVVYSQASQPAYYRSTQRLRQAARECLDTLAARLDFRMEQLPTYIRILWHQLRAENIEPQAYAHGMLALRRLLPQLIPEAYQQLLPHQDRQYLYQLISLTLSSPLMREKWSEASRYGTDLLLEEILRTARRHRDTRALPALRVFSRQRTLPPDLEALRGQVAETQELLEEVAMQEQQSTYLLRGAAAPAPPADELLRPVAAAASETDPTELLRAAPQAISLATGQETLPSRNQEVSRQ